MKYSSKDYSNPFFNSKKKGRKNTFYFEFSWKIRIILILFFAIFFSSIGFAVYSNYFMINDIEVTNEGRIDIEEVRQIALNQINTSYIKIFPQKNIFLFNTSKLKNELEDKYVFDQLLIIKDYPNKIKIELQEKTYAFILEEDEKYFYTDRGGNIIEEVNLLEVSRKAYLILKNESNQKINDKKITFNHEYINFSLNLFTELKKYSEDFKVDRFIVDNELRTIKIALENGPRIYFNTENRVEDQLDKLIIIKHEKIKDNFSQKEYIDLRFGDSVYYR